MPGDHLWINKSFEDTYVISMRDTWTKSAGQIRGTFAVSCFERLQIFGEGILDGRECQGKRACAGDVVFAEDCVRNTLCANVMRFCRENCVITSWKKLEENPFEVTTNGISFDLHPYQFCGFSNKVFFSPNSYLFPFHSPHISHAPYTHPLLHCTTVCESCKIIPVWKYQSQYY